MLIIIHFAFTGFNSALKSQNNLYSFQNKLERGAYYSWGVLILVVFFVTGTVNSVLGGVYFSQISVIYFTWDLAAVCIIGVSVIAGCPQGKS